MMLFLSQDPIQGLTSHLTVISPRFLPALWHFLRFSFLMDNDVFEVSRSDIWS